MLNFNGQFQLNTNICYGDKSISHRALIFAAIADGTSTVRNISLARDVLATAECLRRLGAEITFCGNTATVVPIKNLPAAQVVLNCENSGTTARLLAGLVAGLGVSARFVGDQSLSRRPMDRVIKPLQSMGADIYCERDCLFVCRGSRLNAIDYTAQVNSAQVKSAVLIAGLFAEGVTVYRENIPTRNHTELLLQYLGANISADGNVICVKRSALRAFDITVPNDPSSTAFFVALALAKGLSATFTDVLLNNARLGFYRVLANSGARIRYDNVHTVCGEQVGNISVFPSAIKPLYASERDVCDAIDEIPALAVVALATKGTHVFCGVDELRRKESDRVQAIRRTAAACYQYCTADGGNLVIRSDGKLPRGMYFDDCCDHRIAMSRAILCQIAGGGSIDCAPFDISFPEFLTMMGVQPLKLGLVGADVSGSMSPRLMAYLAARKGICCSYDAVNVPSDVSDADLSAIIGGFDGVNVTMPFKTRVARLLGASVPSVNTVGKNIVTQSTDGYGIIASLRSHGISVNNAKLWIVGAGGAAEACVAVLKKYGCAMQILNRTASKARYLTDKYALQTDIARPDGVLTFVPQCPFEQSIELPDSVQWVFVADYKGYSGVADKAMLRDITVVSGLEMLYNQGAKSFALWTSTPIQHGYKQFARSISSENFDVKRR